ncbi:MAG: hypothetical protein JST54_04005 [Deltaproteobacteria bacterium]|nr:hypothetical protein [Deltaproteobacteria bacterium]
MRLLLVTALAIGILWSSVPGALACLFPGAVRQRAEPHDEWPPQDDPEPIRTTAPALEALGFERLGVRSEKPLLGQAQYSFDYLHRAEKTYASLYLVDKRTRRLYFFTPYDGGASVLSADHKRPGADLDGYYLAGGLPNATPDQLWVAHKRQLAAMEETGRERAAKGTMADRMDAAKAWFTGVGKREVRVRHLRPAFLALLGSIMLYQIVAGLPWGHWDKFSLR